MFERVSADPFCCACKQTTQSKVMVMQMPKFIRASTFGTFRLPLYLSGLAGDRIFAHAVYLKKDFLRSILVGFGKCLQGGDRAGHSVDEFKLPPIPG